MGEALCFRCDWRGAATGERCPSCGAAALARPDGSTRVTDESGADDAFELDPVPAASARGRGRRQLPLRVVGSAALIAVATVAAVELGLGRGARRDGPEPLRTSGTLVYLARSDRGSASLWLVDLGSGSARPGPSVPSATSRLVDLSGASPGWLGLEHARRDGRVTVSVLEGLGPGAEPRRIGTGDLVAWGPNGSSVVIARNGLATSRTSTCLPVRIRLVTVVTRKVEWALHDPSFCGPVLSLSRSSAATYFTAASGDRVGVYLTGSVGMPHVMFEGLSMLSASPPSAFLLTRPDRRSGGLRPPDPLSGREAALLGWKGLGGPVAVASGDRPLIVERVLAWSPGGGRVALVGTLGARDGIYLLRTGSGSDARPPRYVLPVGDGLHATFDRRGTLFVSSDGRLVVVRGGAAAPLTIPGGSPVPAGPLAWIP